MKQVLYVEDNSHNRRIVRKILTVHGYSVVEAEDGISGLEKIKELKPPLVLLDIALPGMDGMEIARRVKASEELRHIPLVALTASAMQGDRERFLEAGCDGYLSKPFKAVELMEVVEDYYDNTNGTRFKQIAASDVQGDKKGMDFGESEDGESQSVDSSEDALDLTDYVEYQAELAESEELQDKPEAGPMKKVEKTFVDVLDQADTEGDVDGKLSKHLNDFLEINPPEPNGEPLTVKSKEKTAGGPEKKAGQKSVLIIDDNAWDARLLRRLFQSKKQFLVNVAHSGEDAVAFMQKNLPDLILLDLILPDMAGEELLEKIKADENTRDAIVLIVSVKEMNPDVRAQLLSKADSVWSKEMLDHRKLLAHAEKLTVG
jgi:two-component system cell cycle response regulator DivK